MPVNRRSFAKNVAAVTIATGLSTITNNLFASENKNKKAVCVGGHPDDPETGCGGTLARLASEGYEVTIVYLTRGEAGIVGKTHDEAAAIRSKEAEAACKILNAKPVFAGQVDGASIVNNEWIMKIKSIIEVENPALVFTHWPIDSHKDHQAASLLTIQSWVRLNKSFDLYFFEVCSGSQTMGFRPDIYVDISSTQQQKRKAVYCHTSQDPDGIYTSTDCNHAAMEKFRGIEMNVTAAEAFIKMNGEKKLAL